jgi:predicted acetyltransferase
MADDYCREFAALSGGHTLAVLDEANFERLFVRVFAAFMLRVDGRWAGFAMVADRSQLSGRQGVFDVLQFYLVPAFRGTTAAELAARAVFAAFPGKWEVRQIAENPRAQRFWRRVIERIAGAYAESGWQDAYGQGVVQRFGAPGPA